MHFGSLKCIHEHERFRDGVFAFCTGNLHSSNKAKATLVFPVSFAKAQSSGLYSSPLPELLIVQPCISDLQMPNLPICLMLRSPAPAVGERAARFQPSSAPFQKGQRGTLPPVE